MEHLNCLGDEVRRFEATQPYTVEREDDPMFGRIFFRAWIREEPPARLSLIAADAVANMRAALDNAVWALSQHHAVRCARDFNPKVPKFVLADSLEQWTRDKDRLKYLPPEAERRIEQMQPYHSREFDAPHARALNRLAVLDDLWNYDKHRAFSMLSFLVTAHEFKFASKSSPADAFALTRVHEDGSIVGVVIPHEANARIELDAFFKFDLAFGPVPVEGLPLMDTLLQTHDTVRDAVLPVLAEYFQ